MSQTYEIPLTPQAQTFSVTLAGATYDMTLTWRDAPALGGGWMLDLADASGNPLIQGIPLVTGADLLAQHAHLGLGFQLYIQSDGDPAAAPTYTSLGVTSHLYAVF
jgi:hypothetical protein